MGVKLLFTRRILLTHYFKEDFIDSTTDTFEEIENQKKKGIEKLEDRKFEEQKFHQEENAKLKHEVELPSTPSTAQPKRNIYLQRRMC